MAPSRTTRRGPRPAAGHRETDFERSSGRNHVSTQHGSDNLERGNDKSILEA